MRAVLAVLLSVFASAQTFAACSFLTTTAPRFLEGFARGGRDLDGDGHLDLVAGSSVLFGRGDGTFDAPLPVPALTGFKGPRMVDMNGDGRDDLLAVTDHGTYPSRYDIAVIPNNGNRSFGSAIPITAGALGAPLSITDVTNDHLPDLILIENKQTVTLVNQGDFRLSVVVSGSSLSSFVVVDADNDGNVDLVGRGDWTTSGVKVQHGNGKGAFAEPAPLGWGNSSLCVSQAADLDGDHRPELLVIDDGVVTVSTITGATVTQIPIPNVWSVFVSDLDGDGDNDLAIWGNYDSIWTYLNDGRANFTQAFATPLDDTHAVGITTIADFNEDHAADLVTAAMESGAILFGNGDGSFRSARIIRAIGEGEKSSVINAADIDGDGIDELISIQASDVFAGRSVRSGTYEFEKLPLEKRKTYREYLQTIAAGDVADDPGLEVIVGEERMINVFSRASGSWKVITSHVLFNVDEIKAVAAIDHRVVFAVSGMLYTMTATTPPVALASIDGSYFAIRGADFDRDSKQDLLVAASYQTDGYTSDVLIGNGIYLLRGLGNGAFAPAEKVFDARKSLTFGSGIWDAVTGDFDGDGNPDIAFTSLYDGVFILHGDGHGAFSPEVPAAKRTAHLAAADVDGDNVTDLVIADRPSYWLGDPHEGLSLYRGTATGMSWYGSWFTGRVAYAPTVIARLRRGMPPSLVTYTKNPGEMAVVDLGCGVRRQTVRH